MNFEPQYEIDVPFLTSTPLTRPSIRITLFSNGVRSTVALHIQLLFVALSGTSTVRMLPSIDAYWQSDQVRFCTIVSADDAADRKTATASAPGKPDRRLSGFCGHPMTSLPCLYGRAEGVASGNFAFRTAALRAA